MRPSSLSLLTAGTAFSTVVFCFADLSTAQVIGSGHVTSETRAVSGFHGLKLNSNGNVIITQGDTEGLVIEAEDNILPLLDSTVGPNGILHLGFKEHSGSVSFKKPVIFKLAVKTLDKLVVEGSGDISAASLSTGDLSIELPGSGDVTIDHLKAETVKAEIKGSGDLTLSGEARSQKLVFEGSGDYAAKDFQTDDTSVEVDGSADAEVWANKTLSVAINGSGDISYRGTPTLKKSINGSGEVHPLGEKKD